MQVVPRFYVQDTDTFQFLRADGEGGVEQTPLLINAMPFASADAAADAVQDHCGGEGVVFRCYLLES